MQFTTIAAILLTFGRCDVVVGTKDHIQISLLDATFKNPLSWLTVPEAVFLGLSLQILRTLPNPILENSRAWRCKRSGWGRRKGIRHTAHSPDGSEVSVALKPLPSSITKDASSRSNRKHSWLRTRLRSALQELGNLGCCSRFVSTHQGSEAATSCDQMDQIPMWAETELQRSSNDITKKGERNRSRS